MSRYSRLPILEPHCRAVFLACALVGVLGMVVGFIVAPLDAWLWLLVCFLIFAGITNGMLAWAAIFRIAQARWTPVITRICQSALAFVPVLTAVLIALLAGAKHYMPWVTDPPHGREAWFNMPFFAARQIALLGGLWGLSFLMLRLSLEADEKSTRGEEITERDHKRLNAVAVGVAWMYVIASSLISYDFIMSLSPEWVSTMFAPYYWCTNLYMAMGVIILIAATMRHIEPLQRYLKPQQFQDTGTLMLAFSLFNMGLFYAQYLTIWYENLPEETFFLLVRYVRGPWPYLGWASFIVAYAVAFILLQSRFVKQHPRVLVPVVVIAISGVILERYVLVVASIRPNDPLLFPAPALGLLGFLGLFGLSLSWFLRRYPLISSANEALREIETRETST